jgi:hypothetical protein
LQPSPIALANENWHGRTENINLPEVLREAIVYHQPPVRIKQKRAAISSPFLLLL